MIWVSFFYCACFSFKRNNNNAQGGGQTRASVPTVNNSSSLESSNLSTQRSAAVQNGSHVQPQFHGKIIFLKEFNQKRRKKNCLLELWFVAL
jgi:hypothetical protein